MWQAIIESKSYDNGVLRVGVIFTNGSQKVLESIDMTGGTIDVLNAKIEGRLNTLNANDSLLAGVVTGNFTPVVKPPSPLESFKVKLIVLESAKKARDLGLIDDSVYQTYLSDIQKDFDVAFIGNF